MSAECRCFLCHNKIKIPYNMVANRVLDQPCDPGLYCLYSSCHSASPPQTVSEKLSNKLWQDCIMSLVDIFVLSHSLSTSHFQRSMNFTTTTIWFTPCQFSALVAFQWLWQNIQHKPLTEGRGYFSSESEKAGVTGTVTLPVVTGMWGTWSHITTYNSKQRERNRQLPLSFSSFPLSVRDFSVWMALYTFRMNLPFSAQLCGRYHYKPTQTCVVPWLNIQSNCPQK